MYVATGGSMMVVFHIQFILYKTLVDNDFDEFRHDFNERIDRIYKDLKSENYGDALTVIRAISEGISRNIYRPFRHEQELINKTIEEILLKPYNELPEITPWLDIFVFIKRYNFANVKNDIFGYIYENYLKELYEEGKRGQYFTDPAIVNFMLEEIGFNTEIIKRRFENNRNSISLIDPACGSGTFLYSAVNEIIKTFGNSSEENSKKVAGIIINNIFGLDIAEFPLYLAEMSILMRMLPLIVNEQYNNIVEKKIKVFKTLDSIAEFMDTAVRNTPSDLDIEQERKAGQMSLLSSELNLGYPSYVRDEDDLKEMKTSLENNERIPRRRFDYVIGNPPYISYNESASQGLLTFAKIKTREIQMSNIYGVNLNTVPGRIKTYPPKPNLYAFFIALGLVLLKENGRMCYIIPQTMLTANDLDVVRYHLAKFTTIVKIITFNGKMFIGRGLRQNKPIPTSSLIFILEKRNPAKDNMVDIVHYQEATDDILTCLQNIRTSKRTIGNRLSQKELLENIQNWNFINQNTDTLNFIEAYKSNSESFDIYRLPEFSIPRFKAQFYFDVGFILDKNHILSQKVDDAYSLLDFKRFGGFTKFSPDKYYPKDNSLIQLTRSNQGHITLGQKYKIVWRIKNPDKFHFTDGSIIFNMGTASIITSNSMDEMYYIFALLNSPITIKVLRSYLGIETEKEFQVAILPIKRFIRVPRITDANEPLKREIVKLAKAMLGLEMVELSDLVDFSGVMIQKFDCVEVRKDTLLLHNKDVLIKLVIKDKADIVKSAIEHRINNNDVSLAELRNMPIIDFERQGIIKKYIDDLVFALYFGVVLNNYAIDQAEYVHTICATSPCYHVLLE